MTHDVERRLTAVLHRHAEGAMVRTDTRAAREKFHARVETRGVNPRAALAAAAAAVSAAAVTAVAVWYTVPGQDDSDSLPADSRAAQTVEERVAQDFTEAFLAGDTDRARDHLAEGTRLDGHLPGNQDWRSYVRLNEALSVEYDVHTCQETGGSASGTTVVCPFDYHSFRSDELGLGPFGNNHLGMVVTDGEITSINVSYNSADNGDAELYDDIGAWMREEHPDDWAFLNGDGSEDPSRWTRLWQLRTQQYVEEMTGG